MAALKGHEVRVPVKTGEGTVPAGAFIEAGVLSARDAADLIAAGALGPEETREFPDAAPVADGFRIDAPASDPAAPSPPPKTAARKGK